MYNVGILGIDSVHADTFAKILWKYQDATVSGVWAEESATVEDDLDKFCSLYDAAAYDDPAELVSAVDAVMVTATWDKHADLATQFLEAGVPTLVDKPFVGNVEDLERIVDARRGGNAVLFGGSAIPYHHDFGRFSTHVPEQTVHCVCYRGEFFYGSHVVDSIRKLIGVNWNSVEPLPSPGKSVAIQFENESYATIRFDGPLADAGFGILNIGDRTDATVIRSFSTAQPNMNPQEREETYRLFIDRFFGNIKGENADGDWILNAARLLLGSLAALEYNDVITPKDERMRTINVTREDVPSKFIPTT